MMNWCLYTNVISPHTVPLAKAIKGIIGDIAYVFQRRSKLSYLNEFVVSEMSASSICEAEDYKTALKRVSESDVLLTDRRNINLLHERCKQNLFSAYDSERWLKPICLLHPFNSETATAPRIFWIPGIVKLFVPNLLRRARSFVKNILSQPNFLYLPDGIHAAKDMARLCGLIHGDVLCLFRAPELAFESKPGGRIWLKNGGDGKKYCLDKMRMWGYYVMPSKNVALQVQEANKTKSQEIKVLWVGRLLNLKRVDTIVRAVSEHANLKRVDTSLPKITLDIYGTGPEERRLRKMAKRYPDVVRFFAPMPNMEIRRVMRTHDIYVLSSNSFEGWGAVVSEALEEGMKVIGTYEAGASATILPESNLYHAGDWRALLRILQHPVVVTGIGQWSASNAAKNLMELVNEFRTA